MLPCCWWFTAVWFEGRIFSDEDGVRFPGEEELPVCAIAEAVAICRLLDWRREDDLCG